MKRIAVCLLCASFLCLSAPVARGGGFSVTDQGAKAMGMAGAFTAVADDPSAVYYNAGGLAFFERGSASAGVVAERLGDSQFRGLAPSLGAGATGEQEVSVLFPSAHAASLPFGDELALQSALDFPAAARAGISFRFSPSLLLAFDVDWTEWGEVERIVFALPNDPELGESVELLLDDAQGVHLGLLYETRTGTRFTAGVAFEETPQPSSTVGPFLPDADRTVVALGWGKDWLDLALSWTQLEDRTVTDSIEDLNGIWSTDFLRLGVTVRLGSEAVKPELPAPLSL